MKLSMNHLVKMKRLNLSITRSTNKPSYNSAKKKKYNNLIRNSPLHSSHQDQEIIPDLLTNHQPSTHFRKQARKSTLYNLSNIKLTTTQSSLLEKFLSFCPTHKLDMDKLCHDINEHSSLIRNKELI